MLSFDLDNNSRKARFIPPGYPDLLFLFDTGADVPVWCKGLQELLDIAPDARIISDKFILSGFGKGYEITDAYCIPEFQLSDGVNSVTLHNLIVAVTNRPVMEVDFVIPWSIFIRSKVVLDRLASLINSTITIETPSDDIHIFYKHIDLTEEQMQRLGIDDNKMIQEVYTQDDNDVC